MVGSDVKGFEIGVRLGYQVPGGSFVGLTSSGTGLNSTNNEPLSNWAGSGAAFGFDVGYRVNRILFFGVQLHYAPSTTPDTVTCGAGCRVSTSDLRVGLDLQIHPETALLPPKFDPYLGFGVNFDKLTLNPDSSSSSAPKAVTIYGMEFLNVAIGLDYLVTRNLSAGAWFSTSFGMYFGADRSNTKTIALHEWFTPGLRLAYRL